MFTTERKRRAIQRLFGGYPSLPKKIAKHAKTNKIAKLQIAKGLSEK
tara:strand:- start:2652 stop:2792 length:141 start_codon:yes stop_codon:yes gene_type:complete